MRATGVVVALIALAMAFPGRAAEAAVVACRTLTANSEVAWFVSEDEPSVAAYPTGAEQIQPYFEYSCAPRNASIVTVFTLDGEEVFSDKEAVPASSSSGVYAYPLSSKQGAIPDGEWGVTFLVNNKPIVSGTIQVGGEGTAADDPAPVTTVQVGGVITDARTKKPIRNALFVVLKPGVTVQQFSDDDFADEDVLTSASSDATGEFTLDEPLERNVEYSIVVAAKGYQPIAEDGFTIGDDDGDPLLLNVTLSK